MYSCSQVKKTTEATLQTIQDMVTIEDYDVSECFQHSRSTESVERNQGSLEKGPTRRLQKGKNKVSLEKELANYSPQAKSNQPPVFVNKVLLEHSHAHSFINCLWLLSCCEGGVK